MSHERDREGTYNKMPGIIVKMDMKLKAAFIFFRCINILDAGEI